MLKDVKLGSLHFGPGFLKSRDRAHIHTRDDCHQRIEVSNVETLSSHVDEIFNHPRSVFLLHRHADFCSNQVA